MDWSLLDKEQSLILNNPEYYFEEYLGVKLWSKEKEIVESIRDNRATTVRSCHGSGKTFTVARAALWFMSAFQPAIVVDTAPTYRQVANQFWREFRSAHKKALMPLGGDLLKTQFNIDEDWYAIGVSTKETSGEDSADKFQGFHGKHILFIVDEASGVVDAILEAIDGAMSGGAVVRVIYIGNPTRRTGRFANSFTDSGFNKISISAFDTPNFVENGILTEVDLTEERVKTAKVIVPGLCSPEWAFDMLRKYGASSDVYRVRVKGQPPQKESDTVIGVDLVEQAINTDRKTDEEVQNDKEEKDRILITEFIGVDPARYGDDSSAIVYRKGNYSKVLTKVYGQNTMEIAGIVKRYLMDEYPTARVHIDIIGIGAGVYDRLVEQPEVSDRVFGVNSASSPIDKEHYKNLRAEGWYLARDWLKTAVLENHDDWYQLAKPRYKIISSGQLQIESKDDMKKRGVSSPDVADALILTLLHPTEGGNLDCILLG